MLQGLFGLTLFLGAALLFWVQLFTSKMVLPILGGGAAVWNTCMVFFQVALLLGYLYAHAADRWMRGPWIFLHPLLLLLAGFALPVSLQGIEPPVPGANPIPWLLLTLTGIIGAPFLVLAATAPLLQAWVARAGKRFSQDPYFLYAASNLGSMLALISYPALIEPSLPLMLQSRIWAVGYFLLTVLTAFGAMTVYSLIGAAPPHAQKEERGEPVTGPTRLYWIVLAFVPSSLLLGVTTHLTMDVAAAPLFWVVPLVLYLLTFVLAFQRLIEIPEKVTAFAQAVLVAGLGGAMLAGETAGIVPLFLLHLAAYFATALMCHQALARSRPAVKHLTEFYLLIALGGALGGIFNALLAPVLFNDIVEYPMMLVVACLLRPGILPRLDRVGPLLADIILPALLFVAVILLDRHTGFRIRDLGDGTTRLVVILAALAVLLFYARPVRFALGIAALMLAGVLIGDTVSILAHTRNFYGVLKVMDEAALKQHTLYNGTTLHGAQSEIPGHQLDALTYYHAQGPLGQLFKAIGGTAQTRRVGLVGLGTGTVACYEKPGENWTFFEINRADIKIASNARLFTFLRDCPAKPDIVLGDARLSLMKQPDDSFDIILLDAFASDAIPIHLITREAVQLYLAKLHKNGLIVFHISNRFLDLAPVVANIADSLDLMAREWDDSNDGNDGPGVTGKIASDWVLVARNADAFAAIRDDARWENLRPAARQNVWTDDYSDLIDAISY